MIYLPDSNVFSAYFRGASAALGAKLEEGFAAQRLRLSVMVLAELQFGAWKAERTLQTRRFTQRVEALTALLPPAALGPHFPRHYAEVRFTLEHLGQKIGDRDTIIAAHALALDAILITRNEREFRRVPGLHVENWET